MKQTILILAVLLSFSGILFATENRTISGTISDETGIAIPGVSIIIENSTRGTVSDINGFYKVLFGSAKVRIIQRFLFLLLVKKKAPQFLRVLLI